MAPATRPQDTPKVSPQILAGRTFRMMREVHGLTQGDLAQMVGISKSHLSRVESGERPAGADLTDRICTAIAQLPGVKAAS